MSDKVIELFSDKGAIFSDDRTFRYALWRNWDRSKPAVMFIGLNPSKADESRDDATISTVVRFSKDWGCGGVYMCNLFAFVSTDPAALLVNQEEKVGELNDFYLREIGSKAGMVVFAWGSFLSGNIKALSIARSFNLCRAICPRSFLLPTGTPQLCW